MLLSKALAMTSAPSSPIRFPQSLLMQTKKRWYRKKNVSKTVNRHVSSNVYPKYMREPFCFSPSASSFAPSAVILLLPSLKNTRLDASAFILLHSHSLQTATHLKARKFCLVFRRWEKCWVQASVSLLLKRLEKRKVTVREDLTTQQTWRSV